MSFFPLIVIPYVFYRFYVIITSLMPLKFFHLIFSLDLAFHLKTFLVTYAKLFCFFLRWFHFATCVDESTITIFFLLVRRLILVLSLRFLKFILWFVYDEFTSPCSLVIFFSTRGVFIGISTQRCRRLQFESLTDNKRTPPNLEGLIYGSVRQLWKGRKRS